MNNLIVPNPEKLERTKRKFQEQGIGKMHIIADFDRTLTYSRNTKNKKLKSVLAILREENYLSTEYSIEAKALFEKYHPIKINSNTSLEEKKKTMHKWWSNHNKLLIKSGLNKKDLEKVVNSELIKLRNGTKKLLDYTNQNNIPLIIMSASGLGDAIQMMLEKENVFHNNVYIITNKFEWDSQGNATNYLPPIIHSMNKDETSLKNHPEIYNKIKERKNVILLGDSLGDLGMIAGSNYDNLLKIGFLNPGEEQNLEQYKENFDLIITNDSDTTPINKILSDIR